MINWEELKSNHWLVLRAKVPGGWLVLVEGKGLTFYPDPNHEWDGNTLP